jgi:hypothetical protein
VLRRKEEGYMLEELDLACVFWEELGKSVWDLILRVLDQ